MTAITYCYTSNSAGHELSWS